MSLFRTSRFNSFRGFNGSAFGNRGFSSGLAWRGSGFGGFRPGYGFGRGLGFGFGWGGWGYGFGYPYWAVGWNPWWYNPWWYSSYWYAPWPPYGSYPGYSYNLYGNSSSYDSD